MANIRSPIGTDKSSGEMWVDDEGERRVGGFFIDPIVKNLMEDEQPEEKVDTWQCVATKRKRRK